MLHDEILEIKNLPAPILILNAMTEKKNSRKQYAFFTYPTNILED